MQSPKQSHLQTPLRSIVIRAAELSLPATLKCGQVFRWTSQSATGLTACAETEHKATEWILGHIDRTLVLRQDEFGVHYRALYPAWAAYAHEADTKKDTTLDILRTYFALDVGLEPLLTQWQQTDANFRKKIQIGHTGIRVLKQDPWEALVSFICSSNNNISRITLMLNRLCAEYGTRLPLGRYAFPTPQALADHPVECRLRELGFGYRAAYVAKTAQLLMSTTSPHATLEAIARLPSAQLQRDALTHFAGVGPKVADCVRLFGLGQHDAVPIDVHIARLAQRDYAVKGFREGSKDSYDIVQTALRNKWGKYAGWAQQTLFAAEIGSVFEPTKQAAATDVETEQAAAYPTPAAKPSEAVNLALNLVDAFHPEGCEKSESQASCMLPVKPSNKRRRKKR